jgi:hypothetical protein
LLKQTCVVVLSNSRISLESFADVPIVEIRSMRSLESSLKASRQEVWLGTSWWFDHHGLLQVASTLAQIVAL